MNKTTIEQTIANAAASVEMEGFSISEQMKDLCRALLNKEISFEEYVKVVKASVGVTSQ